MSDEQPEIYNEIRELTAAVHTLAEAILILAQGTVVEESTQPEYDFHDDEPPQFIGRAGPRQ